MFQKEDKAVKKKLITLRSRYARLLLAPRSMMLHSAAMSWVRMTQISDPHDCTF